jgi:hypothetical protein
VKRLPALPPEIEDLLGSWQPTSLKDHDLNPPAGLDEIPTEGMTNSVNPLEDTSMFMRSNPLLQRNF